MADLYNQFTDWFLRDGLAAALFSIAGFLLALFMVARLVGEKRAPANTFAWILVVVLLPWLGVPLYLLIGGRKLRKIAEKKTPVEPRLPHGAELLPPPCDSPIAHTIVSAGGTPPVP
ncbi:MAG TPA: PLDc N-terminal domain-containing protein, partial [Opitutaceae bacterium]